MHRAKYRNYAIMEKSRVGPLPKPTLFEAVETGDMAAVHDFIDAKADVNAVFGVSFCLCWPMNKHLACMPIERLESSTLA